MLRLLEPKLDFRFVNLVIDDRVEITNPGEPLVATERFLDTSPKSRNEGLTSLMRRFGICRETLGVPRGWSRAAGATPAGRPGRRRSGH